MDDMAHKPFPPLTADHRIRICAELGRALAYLHAGGAYHRDVKPDNVLIDGGGTAKLADFGTVRKNCTAEPGTTGLASHVTTQNVIGTPLFIPPEYAASGHFSDKTDAYAFGMFIFVIITGKTLTKQVLIAVQCFSPPPSA